MVSFFYMNKSKYQYKLMLFSYMFLCLSNMLEIKINLSVLRIDFFSTLANSNIINYKCYGVSSKM